MNYEITKKEVWYWPETDQLLHAYGMGKQGWLMFFTEDRYYFYTTTKVNAKRNGVVFLGEL